LPFELPQWSKGIFPSAPLRGLTCQIGAQGFTNNLTPRAAMFFGGSIHFLQQCVGYGDHHFGHSAPLIGNIAVVGKPGNLGFLGFFTWGE
jgi:hypothetical protein